MDLMNKALGSIYIVGRNPLPFIMERTGLTESNLTPGVLSVG